MNWGELLGLATVMGTVVAVVTILAGAYKRRLAFLERKMEMTAGQDRTAAAQATQYAMQQGEIENRVRVLERIITDDGSGRDIALQIEALRDQRFEVTTQ